jgi:hypothetical protein
MGSTTVLSVAVLLVVAGTVLMWHGLGTEISVRRTLGAILLVLAFVAPLDTLVSTPAGAIGADNGWTHKLNSNYPRASANPECQPPGGQGCAAFSDDVGGGFPYPNVNVSIRVGGSVAGGRGGTFDGDARNSMYSYIDPIGPGAVGNANSPWLGENNRGATVVVGLGSDPLGVWGTTISSSVPGPPHNHGCCQQVNLSGGTIWLNGNMGYRDDGAFSKSANVCELRWTYNHEFSHAIGEGHTKFPDETMFPDNVAIFTARTGDIVGIACIYQARMC